VLTYTYDATVKQWWKHWTLLSGMKLCADDIRKECPDRRILQHLYVYAAVEIEEFQTRCAGRLGQGPHANVRNIYVPEEGEPLQDRAILAQVAQRAVGEAVAPGKVEVVQSRKGTPRLHVRVGQIHVTAEVQLPQRGGQVGKTHVPTRSELNGGVEEEYLERLSFGDHGQTRV